MTDSQLPPSGAVPPVPPAPQPVPPADGQQPIAPPSYPQAPPAYSAPAAAPAGPGFPAPPAAPPFAAPASPAGAAPAPQPSGQPVGAPGYPSAQNAGPGYPPPPPGAYQVPVGGYAVSSGAYQAPEPGAKKSSLLGILALILAIAAAVVTPIISGVTGFEIGRRLPGGLDTTSPDLLTVLAPARDQVLWTEIAFWTGTILGVAAIVLGIIAIRRRQGRGAGIAALVVAVLGPLIFWIVLVFAISVGTAAGFAP